MKMFLLSLALALIIWLFGYAGQIWSRRRHIAPKWLAVICLVFTKDRRLNFDSTTHQLLAYELPIYLLLIREYAPERWAAALAGIVTVMCLFINFAVVHKLLRR